MVPLYLNKRDPDLQKLLAFAIEILSIVDIGECQPCRERLQAGVLFGQNLERNMAFCDLPNWSECSTKAEIADSSGET